jgi:membrane protein
LPDRAESSRLAIGQPVAPCAWIDLQPEVRASMAGRSRHGKDSSGRADAVGWRQGLLAQWRRLRQRVPGLDIFLAAALNYIGHQSANQAGSVAFSSVLALFPLLLFLSAAASFVGEPGAGAELANRVLDFAPPAVADALRPVANQLLDQRSSTVLTLGMFATIWAASSGAQAIRTALNRAYGVEQGLTFWKARIKVTVFTVIGTLGAVLVFSSVVILPYAWMLLEKTVGAGPETVWLRTGVRYGLALAVLVALYALFYGWLPDIPQRLRTVLPGALVGAILWLIAATILSYTLRSAARLTVVYGSFAGSVATLVFLYASAVTLIFGAEINGVLHDRRPPGSGRTNPTSD